MEAGTVYENIRALSADGRGSCGEMRQIVEARRKRNFR
jgi:hypothetical protein